MGDPYSSYMSPKRKRNNGDEDILFTDVPSPLRLKTTNLPTRPLLEQGPTSEGSPRMSVAGHLQNLDLDEQHRIPQLDFGLPIQFQRGGSGERAGGLHPQIPLPNRTLDASITPPPSSGGPSFGVSQPSFPSQSSTLPVEMPETPRLRPVLSPTPPPSVTKSKSPPPPSPALWWSETEITGHNPDDPMDDGYGINGIGFLPTPAIANARAERRKKQITEWKNREAKEARQKRNDRRRKRDADIASESFAVSEEHGGTRVEEGRKVRFLQI